MPLLKKSKCSRQYLWIEIFALFILAPILLALPIHIFLKLSYVIAALTYCIRVSYNQKWLNKTELLSKPPLMFSKSMIFRFGAFLIISTLLVGYFSPEILFSVVIENPLLWLAVSLFYAIFSVYPQEFIYRVFFFKRYQQLVANPYIFILLNAFLFSLAHSFLLNNLVFILTFAGGILFATTYNKKRSLIVVSIEHSAYGLWLFTLGLGNMLAFPGA